MTEVTLLDIANLLKENAEFITPIADDYVVVTDQLTTSSLEYVSLVSYELSGGEFKEARLQSISWSPSVASIAAARFKLTMDNKTIFADKQFQSAVTLSFNGKKKILPKQQIKLEIKTTGAAITVSGLILALLFRSG